MASSGRRPNKREGARDRRRGRSKDRSDKKKTKRSRSRDRRDKSHSSQNKPVLVAADQSVKAPAPATASADPRVDQTVQWQWRTRRTKKKMVKNRTAKTMQLFQSMRGKATLRRRRRSLPVRQRSTCSLLLWSPAPRQGGRQKRSRQRNHPSMAICQSPDDV